MTYTDIYIGSDMSLDALADLFREATGVSLDRETHGGKVSFVGLDGDRRISLGLIEFADELTDGYIFDLDFDGYDADARIAYARGIYEKLSKLGTMRLMLADDFKELDRFEPASSAAE